MRATVEVKLWTERVLGCRDVECRFACEEIVEEYQDVG